MSLQECYIFTWQSGPLSSTERFSWWPIIMGWHTLSNIGPLDKKSVKRWELRPFHLFFVIHMCTHVLMLVPPYFSTVTIQLMITDKWNIPSSFKDIKLHVYNLLNLPVVVTTDKISWLYIIKDIKKGTYIKQAVEAIG